MAFSYKPYITADLYRTYEQIDFFATMDFPFFWQNFVFASSSPATRVLFWIIGKSGINALLPAFSALTCYSFIFYVINKTQELFSISKKNVAYVLFFVMTTSIYISVIGGIRMMLALSMVTFSFFRGTVEKKINVFDILIYGLSIFIHSMSLVLIVVCLAAIFNSQRSVAQKFVFALVAGGTGLIFAFRFRDIVSDVYEKALVYILGDKYSDVWEYIMGILVLILLTVLVCEYWHMRKEDDFLILKSYNTASIICMIIAVVFCFEFSIFYRFGGHLAVMLSIPAMLVTLEKADGKPCTVVKETDFKTILIIVSSIIAIISCTRGSLSSLKFFEL